jgi:hypothetical protein
VSKGRDHWWKKFDSTAQRKIKEGSGRILDWWATSRDNDPSRPCAYVFGRKGFVTAEQRPAPGGRREHDIVVMPFAPLSVTQKNVRQRPQSRVAQLWRPRGGPTEQIGDEAPALPIPASMRGFLGNLPAEAQTLLQAPLIADGDLLNYAYYYAGGGDTLSFWCFLAGPRYVTFASGHRTLAPNEPAHRADWRLVCRTAAVASESH